MIGRLGKAERLFSRGQKLAKQACIEEALHTFAQAVALRPRAAGFHLHRALALSEAGRLAEAEAAMHQAMDLQPTNPVLPLFLGQVLFDHAEYHTARVWCERALALSPQNRHAIALYALTDLALGNVLQAYQRLTKPLSTDTTGTQHGPFSGRKSRRPSVLQLSNDDLQSRLLLVVETHLLQQSSHARTLLQQQAAADCEREASASGQSVLSTMDRFCTRGVMGAKRFFVQVRSVAHPTKKAYRLLHVDAEEAYYLGNLPMARSLYARLLEQTPEDADLHHYLFEICYAQGDFQQALQQLLDAPGAKTSIKETPPWQALCLGELLYQAGQISAASTYLSRAAELSLQDYKVFYYLGLCRLHKGQRQEARRHFARAVQMLNPGIGALRLDEMLRVHQALSSQYRAHQET